MANPHGTCAGCDWHTKDTQTDYDGDVWHRWMCWRLSGSPEMRLQTTTDKEPPACESCYCQTEYAKRFVEEMM